MRRREAKLLLLVATLATAPADAHLVNSGIGPFYDGALHLLLSPGDLLGLVALALLAGLRGRRAGRLAVLVLPFAWLAGGIVGLESPYFFDWPWLSALSVLLLGALVAFDPQRLRAGVVGWLAGVFGVLHGLLNGSALAATGAGLTSLAGIVATAFVAALMLAAFVATLRHDWARVAVRVTGSWVAAVGILTVGWLAAG